MGGGGGIGAEGHEGGRRNPHHVTWAANCITWRKGVATVLPYFRTRYSKGGRRGRTPDHREWVKGRCPRAWSEHL